MKSSLIQGKDFIFYENQVLAQKSFFLHRQYNLKDILDPKNVRIFST